MKKQVKFPELKAEMVKHGENQKMIADLLNITQATLSRKLNGKNEWSFGEIDTLCEHFKKDYYTLFK